MEVDIRILGPLELSVDGRPIALRRGRPRKLLLALVLHADERVASDTLIDWLWGERVPQDAANALQTLVSYLRKTLAPVEALSIETADGGYRLTLDPGYVDATRFDRRLDELADTDDPAERLAVTGAALELWRGAPLAELTFDSFAQGDIARLDERRLSAIEARGDALLALGRHREVVAQLQQQVVEHPTRERFHAQLMLALYRSGRQADALRAFEVARKALVDELGVDPGPELQALEQQVLLQSPELDAPEPSDRDALAPSPRVTAASDARVAEEPATAERALPVALTELIGRDADVDRLRALLDDHRLVTLTGPGGAGKTRLALEVMHDAAATTTWWIDLSAVGTHEQLMAAVAATTGAPTQPDDDGESIIAFLGPRRGTLVLDTCEHLTDALRHLIERLLPRCPQVTVLATSRQPLRVPSETVWPVAPLALPAPGAVTAADASRSPAVQLFAARAGEARPGFAVTDDNAAAVVRICELLDGLPLALELAAVHAGVLTPAKIAGLLGDRLRVLVDGDRDGRQHGLRATIDWSYELLDPEEALFLDRLAAFAGSFSVEAALAVAGAGLDRDPLEILLALARQSLLAPAEDDRFRLLDTLHAYAADRLRERGPEAGAAADRHLVWYADFAIEADRQLRNTDARGWLPELRAELPNLRAAIEHGFGAGDRAVGVRLASALAWFWAIEGLYAEAADWLAAARAAVAPDTLLEAHLLAGSGMHLASLGQLRGAAELSRRAVDLYEKLGRNRSVAHSLIYLGVAHWGLGEYDEAARVHDLAIARFRELGDDWGLAICLVLRARTAIDRGDADTGELLAAATAVATRVGDRQVLGLCAEQTARQAARDGDFDRARAQARECLALNGGMGYAEGVVSALLAFAYVELMAGSPDVAEPLGRALPLALELDHPGAIAEALEYLALSACRAHRLEQAATCLGAGDAMRARAALARPVTVTQLTDEVRAALDALDPAVRSNAEQDGASIPRSRLAALLEAAAPTATPTPEDQSSS